MAALVTALFTDAQGSVRAMTKTSGARAERSVFRPYGEERTAAYDIDVLAGAKG